MCTSHEVYMESNPQTHGRGSLFPLFSLLCIALLFVSSASALPVVDENQVYITIQDLGVLQDQEIKIFTGEGDLYDTINTSSGVMLWTNQSSYYTFQIQPSTMNTNETTMLTNFGSFLVQNYMAVFFVLIVIVLLASRRR